MRHSITTILFLFLTTQLFGQKVQRKTSKSSFRDTAFIYVSLIDIKGEKKILAYDIGEKAVVYLGADSIITEVKKHLSNEFIEDRYTRIINFIDSASQDSDTIKVDFYQLPDFEYFVSDQLKKGRARVFYKRHNSFVDTISHRLERFGGHLDRFFYLPDKRPFFGVIELSGLIDNAAFLSGKYYDGYVKEGEKLASLRQK
jgi:hypothetical protein